MLVISRARQTGLFAYQQLYLEYLERFSKPMPKPKPVRFRGTGHTVIIIDDVQAHLRSARRRQAAGAARCWRPVLHAASARTRLHGAP